MTIELLTNRYKQTTPTHITANGCSISTPIYLSPTNDQSKELLNAFREVVRQQRLEMGYRDTPIDHGSIQVQTATTPPQTPAEEALGMNEETLRYALFQRTGIAERLIIKLCEITGVELVSRKQIEDNVKMWLDHLYGEQPKRTRVLPKGSDRKTRSSK